MPYHPSPISLVRRGPGLPSLTTPSKNPNSAREQTRKRVCVLVALPGRWFDDASLRLFAAVIYHGHVWRPVEVCYYLAAGSCVDPPASVSIELL